MFAIIEQDGRQIRVAEGDLLQIDLQSEVEKDQEIKFDRVLLANAGGSSVIGEPLIASASVTGKVVHPLVKGLKLEVGKFRRRKNTRRRIGHRQKYTEIRITGISVPGLEVVKESKETSNETAAK